MDWLLDNGADINLLNNAGESALFIAGKTQKLTEYQVKAKLCSKHFCVFFQLLRVRTTKSLFVIFLIMEQTLVWSQSTMVTLTQQLAISTQSSTTSFMNVLFVLIVAIAKITRMDGIVAQNIGVPHVRVKNQEKKDLLVSSSLK